MPHTRRFAPALPILLMAILATACGDDHDPRCRPLAVNPPACGTEVSSRNALLPGPGAPRHDSDLALKARRFERQFHAFNAYGTGVNADIGVSLDATDARDEVRRYLLEDDGWDFEAFAGHPVTETVSSWQKVAGAYAGVGIAADAFRYGVLRDTGAPCAEVDQARQHVLDDLDALHLAVAITGVEGVLARGFARTDLPGAGDTISTTPLRDEHGDPLPTEKNNGTWRADNSGGLYPDTVWEDSCSRDQYVGWVVGFAALWEVIARDSTIPQASKDRLQEDAAALARSLMAVGTEGYDLEIHDADGRITYHGFMHEYAIERTYVEGVTNGFHALLALGIVTGLAYVAEQPEIDAYVLDELILERDLPGKARTYVSQIDMGVQTNFSNYNMLFAGGWLASRYLCDDVARELVNQTLQHAVYARDGRDRQPAEQRQTLYDFVYVAARAGATAWTPLGGDIDEDAVERGLTTLREFWEPPFWEEGRVNCDASELAQGTCVGVDGTTPIVLLPGEGHNDEVLAEAPLPMRIRPPSNYYWRTNPYRVNGDADGSRLLPGTDFRFAYWMGRWLRRSE